MVGEIVEAGPRSCVGAYQAFDVDGVDDLALQVEVEIDACRRLDVHQIAVLDPLRPQRGQRRTFVKRAVFSIRIDPEPVGAFRPFIAGRLFSLHPARVRTGSPGLSMSNGSTVKAPRVLTISARPTRCFSSQMAPSSGVMRWRAATKACATAPL